MIPRIVVVVVSAVEDILLFSQILIRCKKDFTFFNKFSKIFANDVRLEMTTFKS